MRRIIMVAIMVGASVGGIAVASEQVKTSFSFSEIFSQSENFVPCPPHHVEDMSKGTCSPSPIAHIEFGKSAVSELAEIYQAASGGDGGAQQLLAKRYEFGDGLGRNRANALYWYQQAAENEQPLALFKMGMAHGLGVGVKRNQRRAAEFMKRAAYANYPRAQAVWGLLLINGNGVGENIEKGLYWLKLAHENGEKRATKILKSIAEGLKAQSISRSL